MGIEKDTTFKFIGKNVLEVLFELADLPKSVDLSKIEEVPEELISLKISQLRPDFVGKNDECIFMFEFESSYVGKQSKKRFHAYVALFDYENNDDDLDIYFIVITTKEKSKVTEYKIGETDSFKIRIFNINELGFEEILNNANDKIENKEKFSIIELVKLALTSLMPGNRKGNINQFYVLSDMINYIEFEDDDAKISFGGLLLLLSDIYFETNDPVRKKIQGVIMGRVDCIVEMREEEFNKGYDEGLIKVAENFLIEGFSVELVSRCTTLPLDEVKDLKMKLELE